MLLFEAELFGGRGSDFRGSGLGSRFLGFGFRGSGLGGRVYLVGFWGSDFGLGGGGLV